MNGRFPEACEIRSVYARPYESHDDLGQNGIGCVVTLSPSLSSLSSLFRRYATSVQFLQNQELHGNRYSSQLLPPNSRRRLQNVNGENTGFPDIWNN